MLIAFEGIDGAGKTTAAASLCACVQCEGVEARSIAKSSVDCDDPQARAVLATLRELIWQPAGCEPSRDLLGTHFYVYLNAALLDNARGLGWHVLEQTEDRPSATPSISPDPSFGN